MAPLNALYRFFKSVRLAVVLILLITTLSLLSTLVPQDREDAFYKENYPPALNGLIAALSFNRFFSSVLFIVPVVMFSLNLGACAVDRLVRQSRSEAGNSMAPTLFTWPCWCSLSEAWSPHSLGRRMTSR